MSETFYYTVIDSVLVKLTRKNSRFIGQAFHVLESSHALGIIGDIKKKYHDATHNCWVFRLGVGDQEYHKFSDAGEPLGTAGSPMYRVLVSRNVSDVVVIVTRYFGGTQLGRGGLIRAYSQCVNLIMDSSSLKKVVPTKKLTVILDYDIISVLYHLVDMYQVRIFKQDFQERVIISVIVPLEKYQEFYDTLLELGKGKISIKRW
jgi:uncharacterized YigZ family protein